MGNCCGSDKKEKENSEWVSNAKPTQELTPSQTGTGSQTGDQQQTRGGTEAPAIGSKVGSSTCQSSSKAGSAIGSSATSSKLCWASGGSNLSGSTLGLSAGLM